MSRPPAPSENSSASFGRHHGWQWRGRISTGVMRKLVVAVVGVALAATAGWLRPNPDHPVPTITWRSTFQRAQERAHFPVLVPTPIPAGWRATSVRVTSSPGGSAAWHLGLTTGDGEYASVEQTDGDRSAFKRDMTRSGEPQGAVRVGGQTWQRRFRLTGTQEYRSLLRNNRTSMIIVAGTATYGQLGELAAALSPESSN